MRAAPRAPSQTRRVHAERAAIAESPLSEPEEERAGLLERGAPPAAAAQQAQAQHAVALSQQNETLDKLSVAVGALHELSGAISGELEEQAVMMEEASLAVAVAQGDVDAVTLRVKRMVEATGGVKWCSVVSAMVALLLVLTWIAFS